MSVRFAGFTFLLVATVLTSVPPAAAQRAIPAAGETIDVSLVNVDVFVTDGKGRRITGLTKDDFEIVENGRVQPITNFSEYSSDLSNERMTADTAPAVAPGARRAVAAAPEPRTIVVFVERFMLPKFHTAPVFEALRNTLHRTVRPGDAATVIFWDGDSAFTLQDFTDDLAGLDAALIEIEQQSTGVQGSIDSLLREEAFAKAFYDSLPPEKVGMRTDLNPSHLEDLSNAELALFRYKRKSRELQAIIRSISGVEGRKVMLLATSDFGLYAGARAFKNGRVPAKATHLKTDVYREELARTANQNNVTIYPVYPIGLESTHTATAMESRANIYAIDRQQDAERASRDNEVLLNQTAALDELADDTGGLLAWGSKDIASMLPRVVEDLNSYYSLAYRTPTTGTTKSRDIRVRTKNRDYVVRARREYVEKTDVTRMEDRVIANLYHPADGGTIPFAVELGKIEKTSRTRWSVPLRIEVPADALMTVDGKQGNGSFSVFLATGGVIGMMSDIQKRTQPFSVAALPKGQTHFTYEFTLSFNGATTEVSIGVFDDVSKEYGVRTVELPLFGTEDETPQAE
jgi:VWFA-related protein